MQTVSSEVSDNREPGGAGPDVPVLDERVSEHYLYGVRPVSVYSLTEYELDTLYYDAVASCFLVGIPFLIIGVFRLIRRLKKETEFNV